MILLDTHAWFWLVDRPSMLSQTAASLIRSSELVHISAISFWEHATLLRKGRIEVGVPPNEWVEIAASLPGLAVAPVDQDIAWLAGSGSLGLHGDPADRIIAATALIHRARLITKDARLQAHAELNTIW